jgi:enterochelin esterase-like enzyme
MFEITGQPVFILCVLLAVALPILITVMWSRRSAKPSSGPRFVFVVAGRIGVIVLAQLMAMMSIFLAVNNEYQFYSSWADLFGVSSGPPPPVRTTNVISGTGSVEVMTVNAKSGVTADTLVWLPPGYAASGQTKYPVVMFLPGQPSSPQTVFNEYDFGNVASQEVTSGKVKPFVAVFPPIMIAPPRDTECVDVPNGPQAETWLASDVPNALQAKYRVEAPGKHWSLMGWSAGGLCVAKLLLKYPTTFSAAVSFGGAYQAYLDNTTGDLFGGNAQLQNENSSIWLYKTYGMRGGKLLMVSGKQDAWSWTGTTQMSLATNGDPNVTVVSFPTGGHNYRSYKPFIPQGLEWLAKSGAVA